MQHLPTSQQMYTIGVFFGGRSIEREVSFNSGRTICDHLDTQRFTVLPIFQAQDGTLYILPQHFLHRGKISDFEHRLSAEARRITWDDLPQLINCAFIALHGRFAEDGTLQGMFEVLQIPYFGSKTFASALGMDKSAQKTWLTHAQIMVPKGCTLSVAEIKNHKNLYAFAHQKINDAQLQYPLIIKPVHEGSSLGIKKIKDETELLEAILHAAHISQWIMQPVIIEECVQGMEFSCIIITDPVTNTPLALPPTEIVPESEEDVFNYEQKYMPGRACKYTPARCNAQTLADIQAACIKTMQALHMSEFARIDGFVKADGSIVIIDANTLGGMAPASFTFLQAAEIGLSHTQLINHLVDTTLRAAHILPPYSKKSMNTPTEQKMRVAVLMGGDSAEREISLESGRNITYKLSPHKYTSIPLFVDEHMHLYRITQKQLVKNSTKEITASLQPEQKIGWNDLSDIADFVFIGLHGGKGENGNVQGALELLNMPYNGSGIAASALCMDKYLTGQYLKKEGFAVPEQLLLHKATWLAMEDKNEVISQSTITFPAIVKPHDDGCSVLVQKINTHSELIAAIDAIFAQGRMYALVESFIVGMELTVGVLGNETAQALPPSYTVTTKDILSIQEKFLPGAGENQTPAPLPAQTLHFVQKTIAEAFTALGCRGYARIDCFYQTAAQSPTGEERLVILECNSLPGLTPATCIFHQAAEIGMQPMSFIDTIIELGFEAHADKKSRQSNTSQDLILATEPTARELGA